MNSRWRVHKLDYEQFTKTPRRECLRNKAPATTLEGARKIPGSRWQDQATMQMGLRQTLAIYWKHVERRLVSGWIWGKLTFESCWG